ncbi:MAG: acyl carrier protein [Clostridia bacterium]|nr:acyl carrier protein [Clostridia bacterium]NCC74955.1 acyl carrier protein [Clostridia bacterium]
MSTDSIFTSVQNILIDQLGVDADSVNMQSNFIDDLNADSLDIVELVMAMEQEFNISIPDEDAEKIKSVGDAVEYIKANT